MSVVQTFIVQPRTPELALCARWRAWSVTCHSPARTRKMPREKVGCCCPFTDPDLAARKLVEIANGVEVAQDGRIYIGRVTYRTRMSALLRNRHDCWTAAK
jgi:hypothetical protein